jgi:hypothetical protein
MREIRPYGSEGGGAGRSPYPYQRSETAKVVKRCCSVLRFFEPQLTENHALRTDRTRSRGHPKNQRTSAA